MAQQKVPFFTQVSVKRTNQPGMTRGRGRGRGYRGGMGFMGPGGMMYVPVPMSGFGSGYGGSNYRGSYRGRYVLFHVSCENLNAD